MDKNIQTYFYFANEKIFNAEDRAKINRELNFFFLWEMENWISGTAGRTRQQGAAMAFLTIKLRVNFDP